MRGHRLTTLLAAFSIGSVLVSTPATAAPSTPPAQPGSAVAAGGADSGKESQNGPANSKDPKKDSGEERAPLTPEQVKAQVAEATALQAQLRKEDAALADAGRKLATLAARSNALMSRVGAARAAEAEAARKEAAELARLKQLTAEVTAAQQQLDAMAYDAYVNGPGLLREVAALVDLVGSGGEGADAAAKADYLARTRAADEAHYRKLATRQRTTAQRAAAARAAREKATAEAEKVQKAAAAAVAEQQTSVVALQKLTAERRDRLNELGVDGGLLAGVDLSALEKVTTTPLCTEENAAYPNGQWPGSALCGLQTAPGHMLRPSAARAFDALSEAYTKAHGTNLCITDSYRSLAAQIDVRRRKPTLAAKPGTSNHGLGLAVDLCGGIESFGTAQHLWMQQHAPLFGFFHPAWAQAGGSKPEPWHWEFAG
ncbi:M15 family metallopeptidase [Mobilicoccus massiliensis]|uniref:M15 family metallopeptidase n=1 Tax=Mobilicoccus massiliensis TaxID=1522310 RepID=UPI0006945373|nr:M15 family metallopeptidase [Mobilicoccus massiliensis]